jgi:hypothetical protein
VRAARVPLLVPLLAAAAAALACAGGRGASTDAPAVARGSMGAPRADERARAPAPVPPPPAAEDGPRADDLPASAEEPAPPTQDEGPAPLTPPDRTQPPWSQRVVPPIAEGEVQEERLEGGRHLRVGTSRGSVHVWLPGGYARRRAGVVLYVHGYYTDVDQAFADHALARQFRRSGRNALFVVPDAPAWNGDPVAWPDLDALLAEVTARTGLPIPAGPVVAAGHSGAIRTLLAWLGHPRVDELVLLDALYRGEDELAAWLAGAPAGKRRVLLVGFETAPRTEAWLPSLPRAVRHARATAPPTAADRRAPVVYWRARTTHMRMVTDGRILPLVLHATRAPALPAPAPASAVSSAHPEGTPGVAGP